MLLPLHPMSCFFVALCRISACCNGNMVYMFLFCSRCCLCIFLLCILNVLYHVFKPDNSILPLVLLPPLHRLRADLLLQPAPTQPRPLPGLLSLLQPAPCRGEPIFKTGSLSQSIADCMCVQVSISSSILSCSALSCARFQLPLLKVTTNSYSWLVMERAG